MNEFQEFEEDRENIPAEIRRGWRTEQRMYELGYCSVHEFSKDMNQKCQENAVSEDTILNVIKGKSVQMNTLICLAKCLKVPVPFLAEEEIPLLDDHLEEIYDTEDLEERRQLWREEVSENKRQGVTMKYGSRLMKLYNISNCFYWNTGRGGNGLDQLQGGIFTIADLILYLPLCDPWTLVDLLRRIRGEIAGYEEYVINQFSHIYINIPDIPAKRFANNQSAYLRLARKTNLSLEEKKKKAELKALCWKEEGKEGWRQYCSILDRWDQFFAENAIKQFWKSMFPELQRK